MRSFLTGKTVKTVRPMTSKEMERESWTGAPALVIEFVDGTLVYPSRDEEGNGPGALFGFKENQFLVFAFNTRRK